jgi:hypothetical protein
MLEYHLEEKTKYTLEMEGNWMRQEVRKRIWLRNQVIRCRQSGEREGWGGETEIHGWEHLWDGGGSREYLGVNLAEITNSQ